MNNSPFEDCSFAANKGQGIFFLTSVQDVLNKMGDEFDRMYIENDSYCDDGKGNITVERSKYA